MRKVPLISSSGSPRGVSWFSSFSCSRRQVLCEQLLEGPMLRVPAVCNSQAWRILSVGPAFPKYLLHGVILGVKCQWLISLLSFLSCFTQHCHARSLWLCQAVTGQAAELSLHHCCPAFPFRGLFICILAEMSWEMSLGTWGLEWSRLFTWGLFSGMCLLCG